MDRIIRAETIVIEGKDRLRLVPFSEEHLSQQCVDWLNDPDVVRYSENRHRSHDLESYRKYYRKMHSGDNPFWAIMWGDRHVGNISAYMNYPNNVTDVTIMIGEAEARGRRFGTRSWAATCDYLFGSCGIRKITAGTISVNKPMLAIMQATGMQEEGRCKRHLLFEGKEVDVVMAARFRTQI
jgi:RimJ/RimL family protein N-acetyltransferase